ncbi:hypothetical protein [Microbacterium sp. cx-59]|uniref:hypothetical protein n=1 Tax=Microbacterium sp. cx-59 TaxID=2891207 RepID=UPI001E2C7D93|nr:hypothetical protein [Microbacterium sp. cx-59]MCC4907777.1 hypothetical protein [Microbacterium sp. cx-59]
MVVVLGGQALGAFGSYQPEKWQLEATALDEIHINVGMFMFAHMDATARAEEILDTICHELAHLYARVVGLKDTSGRGNRYHNRTFARLATLLGLRVAKNDRSYIGHVTVGLSEVGRDRFGDLVAELESAIRLLPASGATGRAVALPSVSVTPLGLGEGEAGNASKYVSAQCKCRDQRGRPRTIRMARGWWLEDSVGCALCQHVFAESPPMWRTPTSTHPKRAR